MMSEHGFGNWCAVAFAAFVASGSVGAEPNNEQRCAKAAAERFKSGVRDAGPWFHVQSYESHYNRTRNKCFVLVTRKVTDTRSYKVQFMLSLHDIDDDDRYVGRYSRGAAVPDTCEIRGLTCETEEEWRTYAKPLMVD
jgi:hypothetical protein